MEFDGITNSELWESVWVWFIAVPVADLYSTIVQGLDKFKYMKVSEPRSFDSCTKGSLVCASAPYSGYSSAATFITKKKQQKRNRRTDSIKSTATKPNSKKFPLPGLEPGSLG